MGVLAAQVTWVRRKGMHTLANKPDSVEEELTLNVGGLITPTEERVRQLNRKLKVDDEVRIRVVEDATLERPRSPQRRDHSKELRSQKRNVRERAKRFGWKIQTR